MPHGECQRALRDIRPVPVWDAPEPVERLTRRLTTRLELPLSVEDNAALDAAFTKVHAQAARDGRGGGPGAPG